MPKKRKKPTKTEELVSAASKVASLWMDFRKGFQRALGAKEITNQDEQHFLEIKSHLSRLQRILAQRLPEGFKYGSKRMTEIMGQTISISALREMPPSDRRSIYQQWHEAYIALENLQGILDVMEEGFPVKFEVAQAKSGNIKKDLAAKEDKKSGGGVKILAVIIIAAVGYYLYTLYK